MNQSNKQIDYSLFGGTPVDVEPQQNFIPENAPQVTQIEENPLSNEKVDYSQFGGTPAEPEKRKAGKFESALLGLYEGVLGIPGMVQYGVNEWSKGLEGEDVPKQSFEKENPILSNLSKLPESKDEAARRFRVAGQTVPIASFFGIPGLVAGLIGSQAGQTVREVFGKEGKFEEFGLGEVGAIAADFTAGLGVGLASSLARSSARIAGEEIPAIFRNPTTALQRKVTQVAVQQEENALNEVINNFSKNQLKSFEENAAKISPDKYSDFTHTNVARLKQDADTLFRSSQLSIISPLESTPEQAGRTIQDSANLIFRNEVLSAERKAYKEASAASKDLKGTAPQTLRRAKDLRDELTSVEPTPEQRPVIQYLNNLIEDLETNVPSKTQKASTLIDTQGNPLVEATETKAHKVLTERSANDLVELVQRGNQQVNYGSELRLQSHRLIPILQTLRDEVGLVLGKNPTAQKLYNEANLLHARNAETWGTRYMRNVRFAENPESIISSTKKASNLRNFKVAIQDPTVQGIAERAIVDDITAKGSSESNMTAIKNISPELSPVSRAAADNLINQKNPLTDAGSRAIVKNGILKEATQSVNTGKRPEKILDLMQTPKGYQLVKESLNATTESKSLFKSFERLFLEDVVSSITDKSGVINFTKARDILKNPDMREVLTKIGGEPLIKRFTQLEKFANNFERNIAQYSKPEVQSLFKSAVNEAKNVSILTAVLHSLHVPWPIIAGLGLAKAGTKVGKVTFDILQKKILSNPRAIHYLEKLSQAATPDEIAKQLPRFINELEKKED